MVSLFLNVVRIRFCTENPLSHPAVCTLEVKANLARTLKLGNSGWNLAIRCHSFHIWSLGYCSATTVLFRRLHSWMVVSASINGSDVFCFSSPFSFHSTVCGLPNHSHRVWISLLPYRSSSALPRKDTGLRERTLNAAKRSSDENLEQRQRVKQN